MRDNGPEPIIVQIKESVRQSDALDSELTKLAALERSSSMSVEKRWAGAKYLELLSFPKTFTEAQALAVVAKLQSLPSVEKVVALSAYNLEFRSGDFAREFGGSQAIPDESRRGFDTDRVSRGASGATGFTAAVMPAYASNRIIVRWKDEYVWKADQTGFSQKVVQTHAGAGCRVASEQKVQKNQLIQTLEFDSSKASVSSMLARYQAMPEVDYAQPDYVYTSSAIPNDPWYPNQIYLPQISAPQAWNLTTGNDALKIAIGDTGANTNLADLAANLCGGRNFVANPPNSNYQDDDARYGHGTHVAGIVGAQGNNGLQIAGVAWDVCLLHLKVLDSQGSGSSSTVSQGINYAWQNGATAINLSLGGPPSSTLDTVVFDAVKNARTNGMVVVAAAGNSGVDLEQPGNLVTPACIPTSNLIAVGASKIPSDLKSDFSNYGIYRAELTAPGENIYSLNRDDPNTGRYLTGTSQAAPQVTGALQLVKSKYPWEDFAGIKDRVLMGTDSVGSLASQFRTGGRLNLNTALMKRSVIRNLSTRARVESGDRRMIGGFYVGGSGTLKLAIRGIGPSLPNLGVAKLNNPQIRLNNSAGQQIFFNNDWGNLPADQKTALAGAGLTPTDNREAALVQTLAAGGYTVFVESQDGQFGVGSFEIYELEGGNNERTRLVNLSTRCVVGTGNEVAIAGTALGTPGAPDPIPKRRILFRGEGPSLPLTGTLGNPYLELHDASGATILANDQWQNIDGTSTGLEAQLNESGFAPTNVNESALWPTLRPNFYTAILKGAAGGSGLGLIEFYEY